MRQPKIEGYSFEKRYPELYKAGEKIARATAVMINAEAERVKADTPYKAQGILEAVIASLERRV